MTCEGKFRRRSFVSRYKMSQAELDKYYELYRKYRYEKGKGIGAVTWRRLLHPILLLGVRLDRIFHRERLEVIYDRRIKTNRPKIYACTHIGGHDIERSFEGIKEHAFLFVADLRELYRSLDGLALFLNGMVCLESRSVTDRKIAKEGAIELLHRGGNLLIYPEGAFNLSENLLVNPLYKGTASIALKTGADIIPVAIEQYNKTFYVNIGKNIDSREWEQEQIIELTEFIRQKMANLKWEIIERNGLFQRDEEIDELKKNWIDSIFSRADYSYTAQDVYETQCYTKEQIEQKEAWTFVDKLRPSKYNAFLFRALLFKK